MLTGLSSRIGAVLATGALVAGGLTVTTLFGDGEAAAETLSPAQAAQVSLARESVLEQIDATQQVSLDREEAAAKKAAEKRAAAIKAARLKAERKARAEALARASRAAARDPRGLAKLMLAEAGFGAEQFGCLDSLWQKESNWNYRAQNPSSGAYGIPQSLPGNKMASAGADWQTNPRTQIAWGLDYIRSVYGSPCGAWAHSQANNWY